MIYNYITQLETKPETINYITSSTDRGLKYLKTVDTLTKGGDSLSADEVIEAIKYYDLPREVIPTRFLNFKGVWNALLRNMPMMAMVRNLGVMTSKDVLTPFSEEVDIIVKALDDVDRLQKARIHPLQVLAALNIYSRGYGFKGQLTWEPVQQIIDALNKAFYLTFRNVNPSNKNISLALDVSESMAMDNIANIGGITPRDASAAMALITANVEPNYYINAFSGGFIPLNISPSMRLDQVITAISDLDFNRTNCAVPILSAIEKKIHNIDAFVIYTDYETYAGDIHPIQALKEYRKISKRDTKLIVVGMTSTGFSIADPNDKGMLDVVGFDTNVPNVISDFIK